jgi:hypothetical protein
MTRLDRVVPGAWHERIGVLRRPAGHLPGQRTAGVANLFECGSHAASC